MSKAQQNSNGASETFQASKSTLEVNGGTDGAVSSHKVTILRDATQRALTLYRSELDLGSCTSIESFFDYVAGVRLREIPHHGSRLDKVLKWAEFFAAQVFGFSEEASHFANYSHQAAQIIWASCRLLLGLGPKFTDMLEKVFGVFYSCGLTLGFFLRDHELLHSSEELQLIMVGGFADLSRLVTGVSIYYTQKQTNASFSSRGFDELFGRTVESFFAHGERFTDTIWVTRLEKLAKPGDVSVDLVREFLTPHDRVTRILSVKRATKQARADFTCEWFDRRLTDFTRGGKHLMLVTGKPSTGKTVLSEWVVERLQANTGRRSSEVVTYTIDGDLKTDLNTTSVVKGLLLQLLQLNVGDNSLYKSLSEAYELSVKGQPTSQVEGALWKALEAGFAADRYQTIVIDGIDLLKDGEVNGMHLLDKLHSIASKHPKTKCIVFSRPFSKLPPDSYSHFSIEATHISRDLSYYAESTLSSFAAFEQLRSEDRTKVVASLVERANSSFGWLVQSIELLKREKASDSILKRVASLPKSLKEIIDLTVGLVDLKHRETKSILAWMLAAERPLLLIEVKQLMEIDISNCTVSHLSVSVEDEIIHRLGPLVDIVEGFVRFRHFELKRNLCDRANSVENFKNTGAFPFHLKEAHYDLTIRCLAYIKLRVTRPTHPTFSSLNNFELDELFGSYDLLQYSSRYWTTHFQASPMHDLAQHKITSGFRTCFPASTLLAIIEGSVYQFQYSIKEAMDFHLLALSVRRLVLGEHSEPALQTLLNLSKLRHMVLTSTEANEYYYEAWKLAITLKITTIAKLCSHRYIETSSTHTKNATHRSEMLEYIIRIERESNSSSKEILVYMEMLVTLFIETGETEKAAHYSKQIYDLNVTIFGRTSREALQSYERLTTTVKKSTKVEEIHSIEKSSYEEATRTLSVTDQKRMSLTWSLIEYYEKHNNFHRVEELLLSFWHSLAHSRYAKDATVQEKKIDIALRYVEFLKQQKRMVEAENILCGISTDLDHQDLESAAMVTRSRHVGDQLHVLGSTVAAQSIFSRLWAHYVKSGKHSSEEAAIVNKKLEQTTKETTTDRHIESIHDVTILRHILETTKTVDTTTIRTARTVIDTYWTRREWTEVVHVTTTMITRLWSSFSSKEVNVALPSTHRTETLDFLNRLAIAYSNLRQYVQVENIYRRIFYAVKATSNSSDELLLSSSKNLISFYEIHSTSDKLIVVYRDLALEMQKRHGKTNLQTIEVLYKLGDTSKHAHDLKSAEWAYREIHESLGAEICHREAIRAALALGALYDQQRQFSSSKNVHASLWHMFVKHGKDYDLKPDFAQDLYQKYVRSLKQENKTEYPTFHLLAVEYRKALVRFYGISHESTLKATMQLGELSEEKLEHREEAIAMYEEAYQKTNDAPKGQISESTLTTIRAVRTRLPTLYSTSKLVHSPRAIELYSSEYHNHYSKDGYSHPNSIIWLTLLAVAHSKQGNKESTTRAQTVIMDSIIEIFKHEKNSQRLFESGRQLANVCLQCGLLSDAQQMATQLRSQIIFGNSDLSKSLNLASGTQLDKRTWVFLVSFETTLASKKESYAWEMCNLIRTVFMYGAYHQAVTQKSAFLPTLVYGARLLQFTRDINDGPTSARLERELLQYFSTNLQAPTTMDEAILHKFFHTVIIEVQQSDADVSVLRGGVEAVKESLTKSKFQDSNDLGLLIDHFQQFQGGYNNLEKLGLGLQLALLLGGRQGQVPSGQKFEVSATIMKQIVKFIRESQINVVEISIKELNDACGLLGDQGKLDDLEWILTRLWNARHTQTQWSSAVIVSIGRRLVETQFTRGYHHEAIRLCEDMCYNVRRVWGALDATTLEMHNLLSAFYTTIGNYRRAMLVHEDLLRDTVSDKGEELSTREAAQIAVQQLELLKRAHQRLGSWDKEPQNYVDLYQQLMHVFGSEDSWKKAQTQSIDKWQPKGADSLGTWTKPETFEFITSGSRKHSNHLRKSSGTWSLNGHFYAHRLSRSYSAKSLST